MNVDDIDNVVNPKTGNEGGVNVVCIIFIAAIAAEMGYMLMRLKRI